ncbi:MAG: leucine-rich repeat protein [Clostridia bacterium]|nr:leucine-rich repeat protein [Clostridia bacterium]
MKRIISAMIAVILIVISVPISAVFAETDGYFTYTVNNGYATITDVDTAISGEVTVPETLGGCPVTKIGEEAFYKCYDITGIVIPEGVVTLGRSAFNKCGADFIQIPDSVTEINGPFSDNHIASDFEIRCYVDSEIDRYAYTHRINVTHIKMDEYPADDGVLKYGYNTKGAVVTGIVDKEAEHIVIPETIGGVPVISLVRDAFYGSTKGIKSISFPSTLRYIRDDVLIGGGESGEIILPEGLEYIGSCAFAGTNLKKVYLPSSVTFIHDNAFYESPMVVIFGEEGSYAETYAAEKGIPFNEENPDPINLAYEITDGEVMITDCTIPFGEIVIPETIGGCPVTKIGDGAFKDDTQIGGVTLPDTLREIGNEAFANCFNLVEITLPDSVTHIGERAFEGDFQLTKVTFGTGISGIGQGAFDGCTEVTFYLYTERPSVAFGYAVDNGIPYVSLSPVEHVMGDVTCDGKVALADVSLILTYVAGWDVTVELSYADVTGDGFVTLADVSRILQYIAGWDVTLG